MPLYEYECDACGHRFERIRKYSDPPVEVCPNCGEKKVRKLVSSPAIQFKGTGWYITDYAKKTPAAADQAKSSTPAEKSDERKSDDKKSDDKKPAASSSTSSSSTTTTPASSSSSGSTEKK